MITSPATDRISLTRLDSPRPLRDRLAEDVRRGLTGQDRYLPPVYLYDARGSELFERITELEEYYLTRTETEILAADADAIVSRAAPHELVELGSGSAVKTELLLAALGRAGGRRYAALDISETALAAAAARVAATHPWLVVDAYVGDLQLGLHAVPRHGRRLVAFLGSTVGNLKPAEREVLLESVADALEPGDNLLLGVDLVKSPEVLIPAYDDAAGVTAEFNRNVLHVVNRELDGDLPVAAFAHRAVWDPVAECIEMHLVATRALRGRLRAIDLEVGFQAGQHIVTEHSCRFRIPELRRELAAAGLRVTQALTDRQDRYAVVLARRDGPQAGRIAAVVANGHRSA